MIKVFIKDDRTLRAWSNHNEPDLRFVQSDKFSSLLEIAIQAAADQTEEENSRRTRQELCELLKLLRDAMTHFWRDPSVDHVVIRKKDITHNRRILFYLDQILFPKISKYRAEDNNLIPLYDELDFYTALALLFAVYLHDYGKGQHLLIVPLLPGDHPELGSKEEVQETLKNTTNNSNLAQGYLKLLEDYHSHTISCFLDCFIKARNCSSLKRSLRVYPSPFFDKYIDGICAGEGPSRTMPAIESNGADGGLAQEWLFWILWRIKQKAWEDGEKNLLERIRDICRAHKECKIFENSVLVVKDYFQEMSGYSESLLPAALLRLADNLDLSRLRLEDYGVLPDRFDQALRTPRKEWPDAYLAIFARWLRFKVVQGIDIAHSVDESGLTLLTIVLKYHRFVNWQEFLLVIRSQVEKDFIDSQYLQSLEHGKVRIRLYYDIVDGRDEENFCIEGSLEEILQEEKRKMLAWVERASYKQFETPMLRRGVQLESFSTDGFLGTLHFTSLPNDLPMPTSRDLAYLLGYLEASGGSDTCANVAERIGIPECAMFNKEYIHVNQGEVLQVVLRSMPGSEHNIRQDVGDVLEDRVLKIAPERKREVQDFIRVFREHPALLRQKLEEFEILGGILPFSRRSSSTISTGIVGLDAILDPYHLGSRRPAGFKHSRNILVIGGPGTGKTTFLAQILDHNLRVGQRTVLMLTFEELEPVLTYTCREHFGLKLGFVQNIRSDSGGIKSLLTHIHERIQEDQPEIVAFDGLSRLRRAHPDEKTYREFIDNLFKSLQIRGVTCFFSLEEPTNRGPAEEYQADGVIHLYREGEFRYLEIEKLRSQNFIPGRHAFEIIDRFYIEREKALLPNTLSDRLPFAPGINVYPNEQHYATHAETEIFPDRFSGTLGPVIEYIATGINNLDSLLPASEGDKGGYRQGDSILVLGSPGAGKTLFGLHFLAAEITSMKGNEAAVKCEAEVKSYTEEVGLENSRVLWLSFEGPRQLLHRAIASFDEKVGLRNLLNNEDFIFHFVPPALISPEKVLFRVTHLVENFGIKRIVVDSVSEIYEAFEEKARFRQYMTTFIHALARKSVTSMFLYRIPGFFHTASENESEISTFVDTVISIKTFDMKNQIRRGLFVVKSRGRELKSQLQSMDILSNAGIQVSNRGWEMEGLLSGETGNIHEPEVFLKHFYENPAEEEINSKLIEEFRRRYPGGKSRFTGVQKPAIYSEFWSFRGHYGAGHANIRVVSISRYMVEAFRDRDSLHELDEFLSEDQRLLIQRDTRWSRYLTRGYKFDSMPVYTDVGMFVRRGHLASQLLLNRKHQVPKRRLWSTASVEAPDEERERSTRSLGWTELRELIRQHPRSVAEEPYVFALPGLSNRPEFIAFFLELLWSVGGDLYHFPIFDVNSPPDDDVDPQSDSKDVRPRRRDAFYRDHILLNYALWQKLCDIIRAFVDEARRDSESATYSVKVISERVEAMIDLLQRREVRSGIGTDKPDAIRIDRLAELIRTKFPVNGLGCTENEDVITLNNHFGEKALGFLYELVFDSAGSVPNPYHGDFRNRAVYSRHWYSQVESVRQQLDPKERGDFRVLPLPYFEEEGRRKSCACENVWCLSLIKVALSPEIGWIYIDTLTSKDWIEQRARLRRGFPYRSDEIKSMARYDPDSYEILQEISENKRKKDHVYQASGRLTADLSTEEEKQALSEFMDGSTNDRDIGDLLFYFNRHPQRFAARAANLQQELEKRRGVETKNIIAGFVEGEKVSELSDMEADLVLRSKVLSSRPFFHRIEFVLHEELFRIFSPEGRRWWYGILTDGQPHFGLTDEKIGENLSGSLRKKFLKRALVRMHDRLIFEVLTAFPSQLERRLRRLDEKPTP